MEHWDHRACEGFASIGASIAASVSGVIALVLFGAIGFGFL